MRVAYFSPLPPARSGIADYSAELLPYLAAHVEVELFSPDPDEVSGAMSSDLPVHGVESFERRRDSYDLALFHLGNHPRYHGWIYRVLLQHPGVVVLHEYVLHHLIQGLTLVRDGVGSYLEEMRYAYGETGHRLAQRLLDTGMPVDAWRYPLFERTVDRSLALLVHSDATRRRVLASRPDTLIEVVPHHLALEQLPAAAAAGLRARFGISEEAFLVASFGFITPQKRLEVSLRAFAAFRRRHPESRYLLAGEVSSFYDVHSLLSGDLGRGVTVTGRLELSDLLAAMEACDVSINLRYPSGGETSGTLMRLLGLGKPVIVSDHGSFAEVPAGCCARVPLGENEAPLLAGYLSALAASADLRRRMGENARRYMNEHHTLEGSAAIYSRFLERVAEERPTPFRAVPPLARGAGSEPHMSLLRDVGSAVADLGVPDHDVEALEPVAQALVELGVGGLGSGAGEGFSDELGE